MALVKALETQHGASASYWKISSVEVITATYFVRALLVGYKDEKARLEGKEPLVNHEYSWQFTAEDYERELSVGRNILENIYFRMKEKETFLDAIDC